MKIQQLSFRESHCLMRPRPYNVRIAVAALRGAATEQLVLLAE